MTSSLELFWSCSNVCEGRWSNVALHGGLRGGRLPAEGSVWCVVRAANPSVAIWPWTTDEGARSVQAVWGSLGRTCSFSEIQQLPTKGTTKLAAEHVAGQSHALILCLPISGGTMEASKPFALQLTTLHSQNNKSSSSSSSSSPAGGSNLASVSGRTHEPSEITMF